MLSLTRPMINAIAARHWDRGADCLYVFNWANTTNTYNCDHRPALDTHLITRLDSASYDFEDTFRIGALSQCGDNIITDSERAIAICNDGVDAKS